MIHENYKNKIFHKKNNYSIKDNEDIINILCEIANKISLSDNIETSIYSDQNWFLHPIHGFFSCIYISYLLNKHNINPLQLSNVKFCMDLNKTSLKNINKKNINIIHNLLNTKDISDILMLNKLCSLVVKNSPNNIYKLCKYYNIDYKDLILILKINKTY
jgi:DNA polymerase/3'-5' exonuclease PolX